MAIWQSAMGCAGLDHPISPMNIEDPIELADYLAMCGYPRQLVSLTQNDGHRID
jgi:hypothetical protein